MSPTRRAQVSVFLLSFSVLFLEVILTRLFTVVIFDRLHYLPLSMAMLGLSAGAIKVFFRRESPIAADAVRALKTAVLFVVLFLMTLWVSNGILAAPPQLAIPLFLKSRFFLVLIYGSICVLPFYAMGVLMANIFRQGSDNINVLYGLDLIGGTCGVLLTVPVLNHVNSFNFLLVAPIALTGLVLIWDVRWSVRCFMAAELIVAGGAQVFDLPRLEARTFRTIIDAPEAVGVQWSARAYMEIYQRHDSTWVVNQDHGSTVFVRPYHEGSFDCASRSEADSCGVGLSLKLVGAVRRPRSACVIAAGTGQQMIQAHVSGIATVAGVEVNPFLRSVVKNSGAEGNLESFFGRNDVDLVIDEARHYLKRSDQTFDVIIVPSIFAAFQQTVALHSYLFTQQAVADYVSHLSDQGLLLFVMPLIPRFTPEGLEPAREYLSLIERGLQIAGIKDAQGHVIGVLSDAKADPAAPPLQYVLIGRSAWTVGEIAALRDTIETATLRDIARDQSWSNEQWRRGNRRLSRPPYRLLTWSEMTDQAGLAGYTAREITDDFPWLFERSVSFSGLLDGSPIFRGDPKVLQGIGNLLSLVGVVILIAVPLVRRGRAGRARVDDVGVLSFFFFVGCGFMFFEIGLMDKLVFILGHSSYSIAVCLAPLLVGAGSGSILSRRFLWPSAMPSKLRLNTCMVILILCLLALYVFVQPLLVLVMALSTPLQYMVLMPPLVVFGMLLGTPFAVGLAIVGTRAPGWIPWAWGVNGAASVLAINVVGLLHGSIHLSSTFLVAATCYVLSAAASNRWLLPSRASEARSEPQASGVH